MTKTPLPTSEQIAAALTEGAGDQAALLARMEAWAEAGSVEAQLVAGQMRLDGAGAPAQAAAGFNWFLKAAMSGNAMASNMVGRCYENGWGVSVDDEVSVTWFRRAADAGLDWGMYNLATSLALGRGIGQDRAAARVWLEKAVRLGHAKSMTILGGFLEDGWAGPRDLEGARRLYERGAEAGDFRGAFNVGRLLLEQGQADRAVPYLRTAWRDANPGFKAQMVTFVADRPEPVLQALTAELKGAMPD